MSELLRKPYEISLWDEEFVYIITTGAESQRYETTSLPAGEDYTILNQYVKETKVAVIGSNTMDSPIRVFDPKFTQQINGTNTLTFQLYHKYYDEDSDSFKQNPFLNLLVNERKVKLFYDEEWYEFIVKEIQEKSEGNVFTYTCKDLHINELSKNGYNLEFDTELENNQGTITELGERILEESDWEIDKENSEIIQQKEKEALFTFQLSEPITATCMADFEYKKLSYKKDDEIDIAAGEVIYIFYSSFANKEQRLQFLYYHTTSPEDSYVTNEEGVILNSPNWYVNVAPTFFDKTLKISTSLFGEKLISKQRSKYIGEIDKYCKVYYKDEVGPEGAERIEYYGYQETEYASVTEIQNLLVNSNNFISTNGWVGVAEDEDSSSVSLSEIILDKDGDSYDDVYPTLRINFSSVGKVINNGLYDNRSAVNNFIKGESYIFAVQYQVVDGESGTVTGAKITGQNPYSQDGEIEYFNFSNYGDTKPDVLSGYVVFEGTCQQSLSNTELLKYNLNFYLEGAGKIELLDAKLFKKLTGDNGEFIVPDLEKTLNSIIKTKYYLFPCELVDQSGPRKIYSIDDIKFSAQCYEEDLPLLGYNPVYSDNFEKIRSISGSKSNRFNLIQELCETFECWAKFDVNHDSTGKILQRYRKIDPSVDEYVEGKIYYKKIGTGNTKHLSFRIATDDELCNYTLVDNSNVVNPNLTYYKRVRVNDNGVYRYTYEELLYNEGNFENLNENLLLDPVWGFRNTISYYLRETFPSGDYYVRDSGKKIVFKKFIGQDNYVGFRYGINLSSIQRTINSDQVTTKLIVEPNVNAYAPNGSCTIQSAALNPTGENVIYNFEYYIRHKLLNSEALYNDLYSTEGGLGLYVTLRDLNNQIAKPIEELAAISNTLNVLTSRRLTYSTIISQSETLYEEAIAEIMAAEKLSRAQAIAKKYDSKKNNDYVNDCVKRRSEARNTADRYQEILNNTLTLIDGYNISYAEISHKLNKIANKKKSLSLNFYQKYSRFIQEGTWSSEDYIDPEDYYVDAQMVSHTSAFPKVSYTINVIEISQVEGYEPYFFKIGDKTYMEDTEFFGWQKNGRPYQEEIVVSEVSYSLDDPSKNTIKVQNFKTQFEDLFQRITATTQSLQYHEGEYKRAAGAINPDGSINSSILQNSLNNNSLILKNVKEESVVWDETGITISNFVNPNNIVRLVSGGIVLSSDGGRSWTTGITGEGINANVITTGRLDTNRIRIFNSSQQTFEWNSTGINAYAQDIQTDAVNYSQFVRFDQFGLYGYIGDTNKEFVTINDVLDSANFSLTWKGLKINMPNTGADNEIININDSFVVYGDGSIRATNGTFSGLIDGKLKSAGDGAIIGPEIGIGGRALETEDASDGNFYVDKDGNVTLKGEITWGETNRPIQYQYSTNNSSWHTGRQSGDIYRRESFDGGKTWEAGYQFVGEDGSDANVTYTNIKDALNRAKRAGITVIGEGDIETVNIYANAIYGGKIYAGGLSKDEAEGENPRATYAEITEEAFSIHPAAGNPVAQMGILKDTAGVRLILGQGISFTADDSLTQRFRIDKFPEQTDIFYRTSWIQNQQSVQDIGFSFIDDGAIIRAKAQKLEGFYLTFS